jgi:hypothetical protein
MNKLLILQVILNELNHISSDTKYYLAMENDPVRSVIIYEDEKEMLSDTICYFDQIDSFIIHEDRLILNLQNNSVVRLDKNGMEWD